MTPDIAIVGGGPAGLALAAILERKGFNYIVYERGRADVPPRGGCLDLHPGSGQRAMKEAGVFDLFKKYSRDGPATIHKVFDKDGNHATGWGEGRDAPEIDRFRLRDALMTAIPKEKVVWEKRVESSERDENGQVVLTFADGSTASGFKLVVGADGVASKIRHLVHDTKPIFTRHVYLSGKIHPTNPFYPKLKAMAGEGSMIVMGKRHHMFNQCQGDGHYRVDLAFEGDEDFSEKLVDIGSADACRKFLLQDDHFGTFSPTLREIIENAEGPFHPWLLYYFPPDKLNWKTVPGVALIGDAAHVTTPFVGDGANCALRDTFILADKLEEFGITPEAVTEYEKEMFPWATDVITRSRHSESLFYADDAPDGFVEMMKKFPLVGAADHK
ncbi:hypothetical protein B0J12DRAFT_764437 [Macrophomina phaseolina]|uniref:FAD-binding domain-containing protein n=1 Tax=Macrophomina phaseolina TaxID=35725 RepID=A0ABQ8G2Y7_9PEZI|nr:hypothetical protein B0J12DRAFT_764437 [Macrophomina phaseolina]